MKISDIFAQKQAQNKLPVLSFEIYPPKHDEALKDIDDTLAVLASLNPDFISVTFGAGGSTNSSKTVALAKKIKHEYGIEPLVHLTCLCYSKAEIDEFLHELEDAGLENILALRGDRRDGVPEKADFAHASDLAQYIHQKNPHFCLAGACYPENHPESVNSAAEINSLQIKERAGVSFFVSQLFFENEFFMRFAKNCRASGIGVPLHAGIMPVINKKQIERMVSMCGASLPPRFQAILERYGESKDALFDAGLAYAVSQIIDLAASGVDGIHLYTMNNPAVAERIVNSIQRIVRP